MPDTRIEIPRVLIAALRGGSGKTIISIGIIAALRRSGNTVFPFKKGPDYIDAGWLATAAGQPCYNLDTFMADDQCVCRSFLTHASASSPTNPIAVIEGNRGLYDGLDVDGTTSTASLAKLLNAPVILCLDCTKTTRTMAAVVLGCLHFDRDVRIAGVILNRVAGARHESILRQSIEQYCHIPVIGAVPKLKAQDFPERHMGLIPAPEHEWVGESILAAEKAVSGHVDLAAVLDIAETAQHDPFTCEPPPLMASQSPIAIDSDDAGAPKGGLPHAHYRRRIRIGVVQDSAFQFYYPDNLHALIAEGAELLTVSPLTAPSLPDVDALYIGGGFPETHASELSQNEGFRNSLRMAADNDLPIYAECGGLMYLGQSLVLDRPYPMAGVLPIVFGFSKKPQGHGYAIATVDGANPFYDIGTVLKGHEFHYSKVLEFSGKASDMVFAMEKGKGIMNLKDGLRHKNVLATYVHIHATGTPQWARRMVSLAKQRR